MSYTIIDTAAPARAAAPPDPAGELGRSYAVYLGLMGYLALVKLVLTFFVPAGFRAPAQAAVFAWPMIAALTVAGAAGVWFSERVGLPGLWDRRVTARDRLLVPYLAGIALGLVAIAIDLATGWAALVARALEIPSIHIPFPASALIYPGGAVIVNVIYYLVPIPLLCWIAGKAARGRREPRVFWTVGVMAALIEPLTQDLSVPGGAGVWAAVFASDLLLNLAQVYAFRRAGFLAAVVLRVTFYVVWHVLWPLI